MNTVLELENVTKVLGKKKAVDNISFKVYEGEIFGFLGPNGAGKTTTIKMITGLLKVSQGEIFISGKNVKTDFENALKNVGGIIENPEMYGYLTGMDNLKLYAKMHGDIDKNRINEVVNMVKLENRINEKVKTYSLGMRQRLGVAQALLHKPKLLILDEPTNGLDPMGIKELRQTLRELAKSDGLSVLVSSHLLSEMELMCDRFGIIDQGKIIDIKSLGEIKKDKAKGIETYLLDVDPVDDALRIIQDMGITSSKGENGIIVQCTRANTLEINKRLLEKGIDIYPGSIVTKSLEEEFMEVTKGSKDQIK